MEYTTLSDMGLGGRRSAAQGHQPCDASRRQRSGGTDRARSREDPLGEMHVDSNPLLQSTPMLGAAVTQILGFRDGLLRLPQETLPPHFLNHYRSMSALLDPKRHLPGNAMARAPSEPERIGDRSAVLSGVAAAALLQDEEPTDQAHEKHTADGGDREVRDLVGRAGGRGPTGIGDHDVGHGALRARSAQWR